VFSLKKYIDMIPKKPGAAAPKLNHPEADQTRVEHRDLNRDEPSRRLPPWPEQKQH
jgi:hypothetical protein